MENITIDAKETIDWITQRRKLKPDWNQKLKALDHKSKTIIESIKKKSIPELEDAFKDQPEDKVDYLFLKDIEQGLIKSKEGEEKNFFGQYKSQSIRDIQALLRLYEKEFLGFAGLAQNLIQLVTYDIPFCRKIAKSNSNAVKDLEFKMSGYESSIGNASREILKLVAKYEPESEMCEDEIDSFNVNSFIEGFVRSLGSRISVIEKKMEKIDIDKITEYYIRFATYNSGRTIDPSQFGLIHALKHYGDVLVTDFHENKLTQLDQKSKTGIYDKLLTSKGFGNSITIINEFEWEIEDIDASIQPPKSQNPVPSTSNQKSLDTIITNRETREEILESLYEVN